MSQDRPDGVPDANDDWNREEDFDPAQFVPPPIQNREEVSKTPPSESRRTKRPRVRASAQSSVMLGPAKSGKTTLLTAIKRACDQPADDNLNLEFIPAKETAERIKIAINKIVAKQHGHEATTEVYNYPFEVHVVAKPPNFWSPPFETDLHVTMSDGGGGFLLPAVEARIDESKRQLLIDTALNASSMILCVDVTTPSSTVLETELTISFAEMSKPMEVSSPVHWSTRFWAWAQRRPAPEPPKRLKRCLNVDRFLLLLTQVDKLCHKLPESIDRPVRLAELIDPVEQARELVGLSVLKTIKNALKPNAQFAIGVISAMGFHPRTGDPFADVDGTPLYLQSESGEDVLRRWTPFGIRDAIYFLATGICRDRVKQVRPADLKIGPELLDFDFSVTSQKDA